MNRVKLSDIQVNWSAFLASPSARYTPYSLNSTPVVFLLFPLIFFFAFGVFLLALGKLPCVLNMGWRPIYVTFETLDTL